MGGTFDAAAVANVMSAVRSVPSGIGSLRSSAIFHEPVAAPAQVPAVALWGAAVEPVGAVSGLSEVSGRLTVTARIYAAKAQLMNDQAEALMLTLTCALLGGLAGAFTLGGTAMFIDLLGAHGQKLTAIPGYLDHGDTKFRVSEVTVPIIIDPLWTEAP
jgi:hypothetical protein